MTCDEKGNSMDDIKTTEVNGYQQGGKKIGHSIGMLIKTERNKGNKHDSILKLMETNHVNVFKERCCNSRPD